MEHDDQDWTERVTRTVGEGVAYYRQRATDEQGRKLTAQALAERCTALGLPTGRAAIAKLERGIRQSVTLAEVLVLAKALGVPPAVLIFPIGRASSVDVLPGSEADPWDACRLFVDNAMIMSGKEIAPDSPVALWADHEMLLRRLGAYHEPDTWDKSRPERWEEEQRAETLAGLRRLRAQIRQAGLTPPPVASSVARALGEEEAPDGVG